MKSFSIGTLAVHAGRPAHAIEGAVATPIFQTSTYHSHSADDPSGTYESVRYTRLQNGPNHLLLAEKLAAIAGSEAAVVTASGMAAMQTTLLAHVGAGERILAQPSVYGGMRALAADLARWAIAVDFAPSDDPADWELLVRPETRVLYCEAITNPIVKVIDLPAAAALAARRGLVSVVDATFATPVFLRPATIGFDVEIHSASKYLNGHSDLIAGAVMGRREHVARISHLLAHTGACLDPHAAFLLERGLKTLPLRVRRQAENALALARMFASRLGPARVRYPGLDPATAVPASMRDHLSGYGGVLAVDLGDSASADRLLQGLELAIVAPSLGGVETLVSRPALTSHRSLTPEERATLGVGDGLVRIACGIEDPDDLRADFEHALLSSSVGA